MPKKHEYEVIINLKTTLKKETLRKELKQLFGKNTVAVAHAITIREDGE